jgi:hypothetical protein
MILTGENLRTRRKTCLIATSILSTTNFTWMALDINPGLHGEKPATICLHHSIASLR